MPITNVINKAAKTAGKKAAQETLKASRKLNTTISKPTKKAATKKAATTEAVHVDGTPPVRRYGVPSTNVSSGEIIHSNGVLVGYPKDFPNHPYLWADAVELPFNANQVPSLTRMPQNGFILQRGNTVETHMPRSNNYTRGPVQENGFIMANEPPVTYPAPAVRPNIADAEFTEITKNPWYRRMLTNPYMYMGAGALGAGALGFISADDDEQEDQEFPIYVPPTPGNSPTIISQPISSEQPIENTVQPKLPVRIKPKKKSKPNVIQQPIEDTVQSPIGDDFDINQFRIITPSKILQPIEDEVPQIEAIPQELIYNYVPKVNYYYV